MPCVEGKDITYSKNSTRARDFFFDTDCSENKWICAVDEQGKGLMQVSDPILKGRKLFVWGQHQGGRHWNKWLSDKAGAYVEIQAGLLKTQLEHFVMEANSEISWTESYGFVELDEKIAHGDFGKAKESASLVAKTRLTTAKTAFNVVKSDEIEVYGSGWGFVEELVRQKPISKTCAFPRKSVTELESEWIGLINEGKLVEKNPDEPIKSYVVDEAWIGYLDATPDKNWYSLYHLATAWYRQGDYDKAERYYKESASIKDNAWAQRNLAMIYKNIKGDKDTALTFMERAYNLKPDYLPLIIEYAYALMGCERYLEWINLFASLSPKFKQNGRLRMLLCASLVKVGELDKAKDILSRDFVVCDVKEGEYSLSAIWKELYAKIIAKDSGRAESEITEEEVFSRYPLYEELDFRMH